MKLFPTSGWKKFAVHTLPDGDDFVTLIPRPHSSVKSSVNTVDWTVDKSVDKSVDWSVDWSSGARSSAIGR